MHGYELMRVIQSNLKVTIRSGTLYPLLHRLEKSRMLSDRWQGGGRPRKPLTLTCERLHYLREARRTVRRLIEGAP
ncbi:MAG: helix-turn-helix transcriptional regulator [Candidatus Bathyarchaeia archaeon]